MSLRKFLTKYSGEVAVIAGVFGRLANSIGLDPADRREIEEGISALNNAAKNVAASVKDLKEVGVSKAQIKAAVKEELPALIGDGLEALINAAVEKRLSEAEGDGK